MPGKDPSNETFRQAADRQAYEKQQLLENLPEEARRLIAQTTQKAERQREQKEREQKQRYDKEVRDKTEARKLAHQNLQLRPRGVTTRLTEEQIKQIKAEVEKEIQANNKAALGAIDKKLERDITAIAAKHAPDKVQQLDKDRSAIADLAEQKRADRQATRIDKPPGQDRSNQQNPREAHARADDDYKKRVAENIRKAKKRDEHSRIKDHGHERE